jgi:hypothetical protein
MSDEVDTAQEYIERVEAAALKQVQAKRLSQPVGEPGDCDLCGEYMVRLVEGACAPCRDKYKLP